jgi:hypothetical protein
MKNGQGEREMLGKDEWGFENHNPQPAQPQLTLFALVAGYLTLTRKNQTTHNNHLRLF